MKLFSMVLAMVFALSLNVAPAMADSKSNDSRSDSRSKDNRSDDGSSDDSSSDDRSKDSRSKAKSDRGDYNRMDTRDVRRSDRPAYPTNPDSGLPNWWPFQ